MSSSFLILLLRLVVSRSVSIPREQDAANLKRHSLTLCCFLQVAQSSRKGGQRIVVLAIFLGPWINVKHHASSDNYMIGYCLHAASRS